MAMARSSAPPSLVQAPDAVAIALREDNAVGMIAKPLFTEHLLAFELTSLVLLVAIVGAVVLGKRRAAA
jgi:NADH:ubiquinone oxidoreductase subunit 6 (subunit J)